MDVRVSVQQTSRRQENILFLLSGAVMHEGTFVHVPIFRTAQMVSSELRIMKKIAGKLGTFFSRRILTYFFSFDPTTAPRLGSLLQEKLYVLTTLQSYSSMDVSLCPLDGPRSRAKGWNRTYTIVDDAICDFLFLEKWQIGAHRELLALASSGPC